MKLLGNTFTFADFKYLELSCHLSPNPIMAPTGETCVLSASITLDHRAVRNLDQ